MPYLTLYERIEEVYRVLSKTSSSWPSARRNPLAHLKRLHDILARVSASEHAAEFRSLVAETKRDRRIFEQFRSALRVCPKGGKRRRNDEGAPSSLSRKRHEAVLSDLRERLRGRANREGPTKRASKIVVEHLDKYWEYLFGHVLSKRSRRIVPRTNNVQEQLFRTVKSQCRRLHGRGHLKRDMDAMLPATPLVLNLRIPAYCDLVYGGLDVDKIAERFSAVDPAAPAELMEGWRREKFAVGVPRKIESQKGLPETLAHFISIAFRELG